ncbi:MAG: hypothetical protein CSA66_03810 [Proteobacteria bacterium]|nr:MAG: hypothetical protein CSA66_03810 [Pseudomonadota bacterium]
MAACAAAYCGQLSPSPAACAAPLAARDADAAALLGAAMSHHHGADEARALGALLYRLVADPPP